jgi:peptidoglycan/xylan/chitin deacetylase (PgdA/CDA1 family)
MKQLMAMEPMRMRGALESLAQKTVAVYARTAYTALFRHTIQMHNPAPLISFSFDDFPHSAIEVGGAILGSYGVRGTYYASLGLMGIRTATGMSFSENDLSEVRSQGHELGCHTFHHCHSWSTPPAKFEESIFENRRRLRMLFPGDTFRTLAYPQSGPRPNTKRRAVRHFACCRFGGQTFNTGAIYPLLGAKH